ncbi:MAG: acyl-CoA dehydrogenase [bacterium]|nr:acyl-CoA dehydrogenase [bacterium]
MSSKKLSDEQNEFQEYARNWLSKNMPPPPPVRLPISPIEVSAVEQLGYLQEWQLSCYRAGLIGCDYPTEYGGAGRTDCQRLANQELGRAGAPYFINIVGLSMAAPTILAHGTEEQKRKFIPGALSGEEIWCQGFSEPGAGSDMANQQTFAEKRGDEWIVNGHKVWTSLGHFAKWMILIARTSRHHKYDGLSYFLCPIEGHKGVTVRPLIKMTGESGFNEVLFEDAAIPDSNRLDEEGKGWTVAMTTLTHERGAAEGAGGGGGGGSTHPLEQLIDLARKSRRDGVCAADDPMTRDAIVQQAIVSEGLRQGNRRARVPALTDHPMRIPMQQKLVSSELVQNIARIGVDIAGAQSTLYKLDEKAPNGGHWPLAYMNSFGHTIAAGSNEIQRNILGERVLGLAKSK